MSKQNIGSNFDDFLHDQGMLEDVTVVAIKRYIAFEIAQKMQLSRLSKTQMAKQMETSRSSLDRLLDPNNSSVTLKTLQNAVKTLGGRLKIEIDFQQDTA